MRLRIRAPLQPLPKVPVLELELADAGRAHGDAQLVDREFFGSSRGPVLDRGDRGLDGGERGDQDDRSAGSWRALAAAPPSVHARHLEVGQQQVGSPLDQRERALRVGRGQALISRSLGMRAQFSTMSGSSSRTSTRLGSREISGRAL